MVELLGLVLLDQIDEQVLLIGGVLCKVDGALHL